MFAPSFHKFHQLGVIVHYVVPHLARRNFCEELPGAFDFALFDLAEIER